MDRGRVGYNKVANKYLRETHIKHVRLVHLERLNAIKNREPGSSVTLDNMPPKVVGDPGDGIDPRKISRKTEYNRAIHRQNKVLLKRITQVLTAPPTVSDEDYLRMKSLVKSKLCNGKEMYEKSLIDKRMRDFWKLIKKTKPFYSTKDWEHEYQLQLQGQRFMRQVNYKRPDGFVDPYDHSSDKTPEQLAAEKKQIQLYLLDQVHFIIIRSMYSILRLHTHTKINFINCMYLHPPLHQHINNTAK